MFYTWLKSLASRRFQSGNVFFALFAAVAVLGLVGTVYTTTIKGPAKGVSNITKGTSSETDIFAAANFAVKSSIQDQTSGSDCDADSYIELLPWRAATAGVPAPVGGGLLPSNLPTRKADSWGTQIGYCTWDHGPKTTTDNVTGPAGCPGSSALRLKGTNAKTQTLIAVISAGPDKIFATKCNAWADANSDGTPDVPLAQKTAGADDIVVSFTYAEAIDANKGATTNGLESMPDSACTPDKVGIMRYEMEVAQVCQADGWHEIGANADGAEQFATTFDAELNSTTNKSNEITFSGFFGPRPITVDNGATILVNDQPKGSSTTIVAGDRVSLMATAASTPETPRSFTLKVSSLDRIWTLRTRDKTPANFVSSPTGKTGMNVTGTAGMTYGTPIVFTITNTGEAKSAPIAAAVLGDPNAANFDIPAGGDLCINLELNAGATCKVTVLPKADIPLSYSSTLTVSAPDAISAVVTLSGTSTGWSCTLDGQTVASGSASTFYSATSGNCTAISQSRTCTSGVFDGTAAYNKSTCSVPCGNTWMAQESSETFGGFSSVTYGNGLYVAVAEADGRPPVMTSPDGVTWTQQNGTGYDYWKSVTYGNGLFVAVGDSGTRAQQVMTSPDGITWTARAAATDDYWTSVAYGNGIFVAVATSNGVMTSTNGISWTSRSGVMSGVSQVIYGGGKFVTVGSKQGMATSTDGISWSLSQTDTGQTLDAVAYGNGLYVAVASNAASGSNMAATSPDGITWTQQSGLHTTNRPSSITYGNGYFIAVNTKGMTGGVRSEISTDGINWTTVNMPAGNTDLSLTGIVFANGQFVAVSSSITSRVITMKPCASCSLDGFEVADTQSKTFFSSRSSLSDCATISQSRTCNIGTLSGSASYAYATCAIDCNVGPIGSICTDGAIYIGTLGNNRIYSKPADSGGNIAFATGNFNQVNSAADGLSNTDQLVNSKPGGFTYPAAALCRSHGADWYLPAKDELNLYWLNKDLIPAISTVGSTGNYYWASTQQDVDSAYVRNITLSSGASVSSKTSAIYNVRCVRRYVVAGPTCGPDVWPDRSAPGGAWRGMIYANGKFVAVGYNSVLTSTDGVAWTARAVPAGSSGMWNSVAYGNGLFVAVSAYDNHLMTSPDGITWTVRTAPPTTMWNSITFGNGLFVVVAMAYDVGTGPNTVMTSPNGTTWTVRSIPANTSWSSVAYGNNTFVAVGGGAMGDGVTRAMSSTNGTTWTVRTVEQNPWNSVTFGNGLFVAVAGSGTNRVMTSPNGTTWTPRSVPAGAWTGVTYGAGLFVAVGGSNRVMTSPDGITWTMRTRDSSMYLFENAGAAYNWMAVAFGNNKFAAASYDGPLMGMTLCP